MGMVEVVCAAFGLTVSEDKTEIVCSRTKGMPESTAIFSVEAAVQVNNPTNEFPHLGGNANHNAKLSSSSTSAYATYRAAFRNTSSNCMTDRAPSSTSNS